VLSEEQNRHIFDRFITHRFMADFTDRIMANFPLKHCCIPLMEQMEAFPQFASPCSSQTMTSMQKNP